MNASIEHLYRPSSSWCNAPSIGEHVRRTVELNRDDEAMIRVAMALASRLSDGFRRDGQDQSRLAKYRVIWQQASAHYAQVHMALRDAVTT